MSLYLCFFQCNPGLSIVHVVSVIYYWSYEFKYFHCKTYTTFEVFISRAHTHYFLETTMTTTFSLKSVSFYSFIRATFILRQWNPQVDLRFLLLLHIFCTFILFQYLQFQHFSISIQLKSMFLGSILISLKFTHFLSFLRITSAWVLVCLIWNIKTFRLG